MIFRKKTLVAAVAGALGVSAAGVAFAQTTAGNVEIYGRLYPEFTVLSGRGATAAGTTGLSTLARTPTGLNLKSRNSVDASSSRLGFRGKENLGGGLSAIWQIENAVAIDQGGTTLASRTSFVGMTGGFGTVKLGFMDTVYKQLGDPIGFFGVSSGNHVSGSNIISSRMPFGNSSAGSFHLRQPNSLRYETPSLGGTTVFAQYSPGASESAPAGTNSKIEFWSLGARYQAGPWYLALAHEIHEDFFGGSASAPAALDNRANANAHSTDKSTRGTAMYTFGNGRVSLDVSNFEYGESGGLAGRFQNYKNTRYSLNWEQRWGGGPWRTTAAYANSSSGTCSLVGGANCSTTGLKGNMLSLGAAYSLSKRTTLFALYSRLDNGQSSSFRNAENVSPFETGMDVTQASVGVRHDF